MLVVARELLGCLLVRRGPGSALRVGRIVEVEAYGGRGVDPSAHSYRGPTPRCAVMFGPAGHAYVYATQGRCHCLNVSVEGNGEGRAVLLRAVEPVAGVEAMLARRLARLADGPTRRQLEAGRHHELARGPGRLCLCFDVDRRSDGTDLTAPRSSLLLAAGEPADGVLWTPRVGLNPASASFTWRWRAIDARSPAVSAGRGGGAEGVGRRPRPATIRAEPGL